METVYIDPSISYVDPVLKGIHQKIFNKVSSHLLTQLAPSKMLDERVTLCTTSKVCSYRGEDETSCAVGCLIPDDIYVPEMEYKMVSTLLIDHPSLFEFFKKEYDITDEQKPIIVDFLVQLQIVHDNYPTECWADRLTELAHIFELEMVV